MRISSTRILVCLVLVFVLSCGASVLAADTVLELDVATAERKTNGDGFVELVSDGIRVMNFIGDGRWELEELDGQEVILADYTLNQTGIKQHYIYVDVDSKYLEGFSGKVSITIEYLDTGFFNSWIQYDSKGSPFQSTDADGMVVFGQDTGEWKTYTWELDDAAFSGRQNNKADFRIYAHPKNTFVPQLPDRSIPIRKITITIHE